MLNGRTVRGRPRLRLTGASACGSNNIGSTGVAVMVEVKFTSFSLDA